MNVLRGRVKILGNSLHLSSHIREDVAHFKSEKHLFSVLLKWQLPGCKDGCVCAVLGLLPSVPVLSRPFLCALWGLVLQALFPMLLWQLDSGQVRQTGGAKSRLECKKKGGASPHASRGFSAAATSPPHSKISSGQLQCFSSFFQMRWPPEHTISPFFPSTLRVLVVSLGGFTDPCLAPASPSPVLLFHELNPLCEGLKTATPQ